jgi:hypothetical protein
VGPILFGFLKLSSQPSLLPLNDVSLVAGGVFFVKIAKMVFVGFRDHFLGWYIVTVCVVYYRE